MSGYELFERPRIDALSEELPRTSAYNVISRN